MDWPAAETYISALDADARRILLCINVAETEAPDVALAAALRALTPAQRAAVVLRYYLDWSATDAAETLGKNASTVRVLTHQGLARLRELIGEDVNDERA
jgi:DNA-directed RNA polymerase specialized sigma24 family protein